MQIASYKIRNREKQLKNAAKAQKQKENKEKLIEDIVDTLQNNEYDSREYIYDLVREALRTRTQKELKEINA